MDSLLLLFSLSDGWFILEQNTTIKQAILEINSSKQYASKHRVKQSLVFKFCVRVFVSISNQMSYV